MEFFACLYRRFVGADVTDLEIAEGYEDFLRKTADDYVDSDSEDGYSV